MKVGPDARGSRDEMCLEISDFHRNSLPVTFFTVGHTVASELMDTEASPRRDILASERALGLYGSAELTDTPNERTERVNAIQRELSFVAILFVLMRDAVWAIELSSKIGDRSLL